jgi:hypothetical protein
VYIFAKIVATDTVYYRQKFVKQVKTQAALNTLSIIAKLVTDHNILCSSAFKFAGINTMGVSETQSCRGYTPTLSFSIIKWLFSGRLRSRKHFCFEVNRK